MRLVDKTNICVLDLVLVVFLRSGFLKNQGANALFQLNLLVTPSFSGGRSIYLKISHNFCFVPKRVASSLAGAPDAFR